MGFRFRRSVNLGGGLRLNISKSGLGVSGGVRGARVGIGPRGVRTSVGIPGTGLYYVSESGWGSSWSRGAAKGPSKGSYTRVTRYIDTLQSQASGNASFWLIVLGVPFVTTTLGQVLIAVGTVWFIATRFTKKHRAARYYNRALSAEKSAHHESAKNALTEAVALDPENVAARKLLALVCHDGLHEYPAAAEHAREAIRLDPQDALIQLALADCLVEMRRYDEAIGILQKLTAPEIAEMVAVLLGRCFYEKGMYEPAITQFSRCQLTSRTRTDEILMEARYWIGLSYLKSGNPQKAKTQLSKVYACDINYRDIKALMAAPEMTSGKREQKSDESECKDK
jgi:Tfp pilus assembly protein PilF